jgi:DNA-binding transcriptional LysR family regulator
MSTGLTIKQLEALYWIATLGTFEKAAQKLNTTQSAISKRIQELEALTQISVFDRSLRGARLTERGEYLFAIAEDMLQLIDRVRALDDERQKPIYRLRIGVTELTAITWLPRFVSELRKAFPAVLLEPEVDMSRNLFEKLRDGSMDFIVIPETFADPDVTSVPLAQVENAWMAKPGLVQFESSIKMSELTQYPILSQGGRSGSGLYLAKWFRSEGVIFPKLLSSDSMTALLGFAIAGLGLSFVPRACFQPLVDDGKLEIIPTTPPLPPVPYCAMYRSDRPVAIVSTIANLAAEICDFSRQYQS